MDIFKIRDNLRRMSTEMKNDTVNKVFAKMYK